MVLTLKEQKRVREALRFLRWRYSGWRGLAALLHVSYANLKNIASKDSVGATLAFRVARLAQVPIDDLLGGTFVPKDTCPHCGRGTRDFDDDETVVERSVT